jgi:hypothetical protein
VCSESSSPRVSGGTACPLSLDLHAAERADGGYEEVDSADDREHRNSREQPTALVPDERGREAR